MGRPKNAAETFGDGTTACAARPVHAVARMHRCLAGGYYDDYFGQRQAFVVSRP